MCVYSQIQTLSRQHRSEDSLAESFVQPPADTRPQCYWYWMNGHITNEGINADLEAMKRVGIGGVELYNIGSGDDHDGVGIMSPEWKKYMHDAISKAGQLGLEVDLNNSPGGWSASGGPWITPELSMQMVTWSETQVLGGKPLSVVLTVPPTREGFYRDVAVLAFPTPEAELNPPVPIEISASDPALKTSVLMDGDESTSTNVAPPLAGQPQFVQFTYAKAILARSLHILPRTFDSLPQGKLFASDDGEHWREVAAFDRLREQAPLDLVFPATSARLWRVEFEGNSEVSLAEIYLGSRYRISDWSGKALFGWWGVDKPEFTPTSLDAPLECCIDPDRVVDLTAAMDEHGLLKWDAPSGNWTIMRFGHTSTGMHTEPAGPGADGLDCDKFSAAALDVHWNKGIGPFVEDKELGPFIQDIHCDSWEMGGQNWTEDFAAEFQKSRGYDLRKYLPTIAGRVIGNVETSERFLWDFRQVCGGLMIKNYFGHLHDLCHAHGKKFTLEPYHQSQFKNVAAGSTADIPMCEFWTGGMPAPYWFKLGASPGHIYGHNLIGAESFTAPAGAGGDFTTDPWALKVLGDRAFCSGVNRYNLHVFAMQPWLNQAPGQTVGEYGTHFERTNTWFEQMTGFNEYIARCQLMLRQGHFTADVLYFDGENSPDDGLHLSDPTNMPDGYGYDVCDINALRSRFTVTDGKLTLPEGLSYRLLVLPNTDRVTPTFLNLLRNIVEAGVTVVGPKPLKTPGLTGQPEADQEVQKLADEIWGDCDGIKCREHHFGKGRVAWGKSLQEVLNEMQLPPDFETREHDAQITYIHRVLPDGNLYFMANESDEPTAVDAVFRVMGEQPELWDPVTGEQRVLPVFQQDHGRTVVPLDLPARGSAFVVFRKSASPTHTQEAEANFPSWKVVQDLSSGPWSVAFNPKWGGPAEVTLSKLEDWSQNSDERIKYYSGKATYKKIFDFPDRGIDPESRLYLDLGNVKNLAEVRLNGQDLGVVWCAPWHVEITKAVRLHGNNLEIDVVNLWPNRMIGDERLPEDCEWKSPLGHYPLYLKSLPPWLLENKPRPSGRYSFATIKFYTKDSPLLPSGLLGPLTLQESRNVRINDK